MREGQQHRRAKDQRPVRIVGMACAGARRGEVSCHEKYQIRPSCVRDHRAAMDRLYGMSPL